MKDNREQELMHQLRKKGKLELAEVTEQLQISESTARRLFTRMEKEGKIIRVHGGVQLPRKNPLEYSFEQVIKTDIQEKQAIAELACQLLKDGDVIYCDAGTTVLCFCMELLHRLEKEPLDLKVYTNSLANFEVLASKVPITLIGGEYRVHRRDFSGYLAEEALSKVYFTKCFLGADGCDMRQYFTTTDFETAKLDEIAIRNSQEVNILSAAGKFSVCTQVGYADFADVDRVVTDAKITEADQRRFRELGIRVLMAK